MTSSFRPKDLDHTIIRNLERVKRIYNLLN